MTDDSTVNSQIVDSVSSVVTLATGQAASQALGMLDAVLLETLGMAMYNAVHRQQNASLVSSAALTAACAKMLQTPLPIEPSPPPPPAGPPPMVAQLPGPPPAPMPPAAVVAAATAEGKAAIESLKVQAAGSSSDAAGAQSSLQALHDLAADPSTPDAAPAPAPAPVPAAPVPPEPVPGPGATSDSTRPV